MFITPKKHSAPIKILIRYTNDITIQSICKIGINDYKHVIPSIKSSIIKVVSSRNNDQVSTVIDFFLVL